MDHYKQKQFTIASIFLLVLAVLIIGGYFLFRPTLPTCFDGIQNQGEKGIDCGGPCGLCPEDVRKPLKILSKDFIPTTDDNFDLVAKIKNPNRQWGIESLFYKFNLYDKNNQLINSREGETYILPQEAKYIIEPKFYSITKPAKIELKIKEINWRKLKEFKELELRIRDKKQQLINKKFNQLSGVVENKSNYDLDKIEVTGLLFNNDKIIAVGKTEMRTVLMGENRYFEINWPYEIGEEVSSYKLMAYTNVFLNENFIKTHGTPEKFKEY